MKKICFVVPYFGQLPQYFGLFIKSCSYNKDYVFKIFTDLNLPPTTPNNVIKENMTLDDFSNLVKLKTGIEPNILQNYKVVDFKPAFGLIYEDYLRAFDFWGIIDIDLILGNLNYFINDSLLSQYDILSFRKEWLSGSFAIFRNNTNVKRLFMKSKDWEFCFTSSQHTIFDECGTIKDPSKNIYRELLRGIPLLKLESEIESFTHLLKNHKKLDGLRVHFRDLIIESLKKDVIVFFDRGKILVHSAGTRDLKKDHQYLHYHYITEKNKITFSYPDWKEIPEKFYVTEFGFIKIEILKYLNYLKPYLLLRGSIKYIMDRLFRRFQTNAT